MVERVRFPRVRPSHLLPTESVEAYERERGRIEQAIDPSDAIEQAYFEDFAYERVQMQRLQRWAHASVKAELGEALYTVLRELNELENIDLSVVVAQWCRADLAARAIVSEILAKHGLDESAIEAEAFLRCSTALATIDQLLTSHGSRRDKSLQTIAFYREMKVRQRSLVAKASNGHGEVLRLDDKTREKKKNGKRTANQG